MENQSNPHHLVLGELKDFLTGSVLTDTLDERYRQTIAKKLVLDGRFEKNDIESNINLEVVAGQRKASIKIDFLVKYQGKFVALIKYAPGSLVTRRLSTLALSRIMKPYQIPIVIVTNGEDAEILDGDTGKVTSTGLDNLPAKKNIRKNIKSFSFKPIKKTVFDQASRIAYAFEIDGACPCDSDVCIIE
ncbi:MAG: type I restriction enzyme HsdR N-terminal domain-containing protein [Desulfobacula sp.]|uniref:type I restriction enzyme HsdR N-terminal domain-containing protein n=1 Tax=Desulfobacula sp. TaxID=2593537 RepID=UPI0025BACD33|nr:type I restriction enzyme HsdR N-terminal domain-containing protein [Desulfobacula sp.]MCD4718589.1 type I restriction enzyme HsdR N-terminal domain-containing protein [Desulfobacula sp.]